MTDSSHAALSKRIEAIEAGYEFMLAYAAQGRDRDDEPSGPQIREYLSNVAAALDGLAANCRGVAATEQRVAGSTEFLAILEQDAHKARAAVSLVLAQPAISSQLIDNLNASIHLRALLTDLFLIDEALKPSGR